MVEKETSEAEIKLQMLIWYKDPSSFFRDLYGQEPYSYQSKFMKEVINLRRVMLLSASGIGKTKMLSAIALWLTIVYAYINKKPYDVLILSGSLLQSKKLYEYSSEALQTHPILSKFVDGKVLKQYTKFTTGSTVQALPKSLTSIQSQHVNAVIVDEAALVDDFTLRDTNRIVGGEVANPNNKLIYIGTPTEYDSLYVEMWENKKKHPDYWETPEKDRKDTQWARYSWSALECPRFSYEEIERMKKDLTEEEFNVFWLGNPYPLTNTVVPVEQIRKQSIGYNKFEYDPTKKIGKIIFGIDYGMTDKTILLIIQLIDDSTSQTGYRYKVLDCLEWQGEQYDNVHQWIAYYADTYKPDYIFVDSNPKGESERTINMLFPKGHYVQAIVMGNERSTLQARMKYIFEHELIFIPQDYQALLNNVKRYTWSTKTGDDHVTALMLSLRDISEQQSSSSYYVKVGKIRRPIRALR